MSKVHFNFKPLLTLFATFIFVFSLFSIFANQTYAAAGINRFINFQGKLVNNPAGTNVSNTTYTVVFTIYDKAGAGTGTALWTETQTVTTTDGIFRVALGSVTPIPSSFNFNWSDLYLGIKVNGDAEMTPRVQLAAVPYAFDAQQVAGLTVQDTSGNASTSGTLQVGNNTTVNLGTNNLTFTTSGATALTLPTSGTVCTTANCLASDPYWSQALGSLFPNNSTEDFLIGGQSTASALFSFTGIKTGNTIASVSGSLIVMPNNGYGQVGIGTTTPADLLSVNGNIGVQNGNSLKLYNSGNTLYSRISFDGVTTNFSWPIKLSFNQGNTPVITATALNGTASVASISGNTSFATLVIDQSGAGDLFTASKSGSPRFTIKGNGQILANAYQTCTLKTDATGLITCGTDNTGGGGSGNSPFAELSGTIIPNNSTEDFLLGGQSTASAVFAFTGLSSLTHQTQASISGNLIVMPNNGYGGKVGIGTTTPAKALEVNGDILVDGSAYHEPAYNAEFTYDTTYNAIRLENYVPSGINAYFNYTVKTGSTNYDAMSLTPGISFELKNTSNTTVNKLGIGDNSYFNGGNVGIGTTTPTALLDVAGAASIGGQLTFENTFGTIQTTNNQLLTLGGNTTGTILILPNNGAGLVGIGTNSPQAAGKLTVNGGIYASWLGDLENGSYYLDPSNTTTSLLAAGNVGIGTTLALSTLDVRGTFGSGITAIASISGKTSFAGLVVDNSGLGDIFTASSSGLSLFTLQKNGQVVLGAPYYNDCTLTTSATGVVSCSGDLANQLSVKVTDPTSNIGDMLYRSSAVSYTPDYAQGIVPTSNGGTIGTMSFVTDNNDGTWGGLSDGGVGRLFQIDLGAAHSIGSMRINSGVDGNSQIKSFDIQYSLDGSTLWTTVYSVTGIPSAGGQIYNPTFTPVNARYWRLYDTGGAWGAYWVLNDWKVYGASVPNLASLSIGSTGQVLTVASGFPSWATPPFMQLSGAIIPGNITEDFLIGGQSSASANFRVTGASPFQGTTSVASISGQTSFAAFVIDNKGVGDLFTASVSGGTRFTIRGNGQIQANAYQTCTLKTDATGLITCGTDLTGGAGSSPFTENTALGTIFENNNTEDLLIGGTTTASAKFAFVNVTGPGEPTASIAGSITLRNNQGNINRLNGGDITFQTSVGGDAGLSAVETIKNNGRIGIGTTNPLATFDVRAQNGTIAIASVAGATSFAALTVDNSIGDLITASSAGATRFVVAQNGSVSIGGIRANSGGYKLDVLGSARIGNNTAGDDITKQTTSDFTQSGYSVTTLDGVNDVSTLGDQLSLVTDLIGAGATTVAPATGPAVGQNVSTNSLTFQRPDGRFVLITANGTRIYDPNTNTFGGGAVFTTGTVGSGLTAFQRADGTFVVVEGGNTNITQIYAPGGSTNQSGTFTLGAITNGLVGSGSVIIRRTDGKVLLLHGGGLGTSSIYDPTATTSANAIGYWYGGPSIASSGTVTTGSFQFALPNGKWIVGLGGSTTTNIYDPSNTTGGGNGGAFVAGPALSAATGAGAHVIQLPDGRMLVILGNSSGATSIYDPTSNSFSSGPTLASSQTVGAGGHSFQRSDGKWVTVLGGGTTNLQLYDPTSGANGAFSTLTGLTGAGAGAGAHTFQRQDGMYIIVNANSQSTTTLYDAGWNTTGTWTSEDINSTKISTYSALLWSANPQSENNNARLEADTLTFSIKTADTQGNLSSAPWVTLQDNGLLIKAAAGAAWAKIKVDFSTPVRSYQQAVTGIIFQRNIWAGEGEVFYRRTFLQPSVFSMRVQDPLVSYGDPTGAGDPAFGRNFATAGAQLEGVFTDNSNRLQLSLNRNLPTATATAGLIIASASANLGAIAGAGTHTIERNNGQFLTIIGGTTSTRIYNPDTNTFSAGPTLPFTAGAGAHSFLLPDGRFFTVLGNTSNNTAIFDPQANVFTAGPKLYGNVGLGGNTFERPDGLFIIVNGGGTSLTNILDPFTMAVTQGPFTTGLVGAGAVNIKRSDGIVIVMHGNALGTSSKYDAATNAFVVGPALTTGSMNNGSTAVEMANGRFWVKTATTISQVYDPVAGTFAVGPTGVSTIVAGAVSIPRPDGKFFYMAGAISSYIDVVQPTAAAVAGPGLPCTLAAGGTTFQRGSGEYVVICGGSANTFIVDAGWNLGGTYTSEQMYLPNLSSSTGMYWKNASGVGDINVKYRTASTAQALGIASWKQLPNAGSLLSITPGDVWFQARIDLQGFLQDLPGAKTRVWLSESNGGAVNYYRTVQAPTLQYWKLITASDPSILTLTSNSDNVFRFGADGQAYTSDNGAWNSGGADLAERYTSTQDLQAGDVVVGDQITPQNVIQSTAPYQSNIMGVVSTKPGFVAGSYTPNSYPIALVGRVPVKISTENGPIKSGDYLTSASIPGYAMKATVAGRVLGTALEDFDPANATACPLYGAGNLNTTQCGTITAFINLTSYNGEGVEQLMADKGFTSTDSAMLSGLDENGGISSFTNVSSKDRNVLSFLESLQNTGDSAILNSEILTGRVSALNIVSPNIVADLITAKTIRADHIEGLDIFTNQLSSLTNAFSSLNLGTQSGELASTSAQFVPGALNLQNLNVVGLATISGQLNIKNDTLINGMLTVLSSITAPNLIISDFANFFGDVIFNGNVTFKQTPTFNSDTAGFAVIQKGDSQVEVDFSQEYINMPVVTASISLTKDSDSVKQKALEDAILNGNVSYIITQRTTKGFVIKLNKPIDNDISFSWVALSINNSKTSDSGTSGLAINPAATQSAAFQSILDGLSSNSKN